MFFCLCAALLLVVEMGRAETVTWSDNFDDTGASKRWTNNGVWSIGSPTIGPATNSTTGYRTHSGANCATTGLTANYPYNANARLVCINYNGASSLLVPSADQFPRLRFWHWFNFVNAEAYVEISTDAGATWEQISPDYLDMSSSGVWSRPSFDLSSYAGQSVLIAFHFISGGSCCGNAPGWYVDDVAVVTGEPVFNNPEGFESDPGTNDWSVDAGTWEIGKPTSGPDQGHLGSTNCAATVLAGNYGYNVESSLISPPFPVPSNGPALRFWHWYKLVNALGYVEISADGSSWQQISPDYNDANTGGNWTNVSLDLSAYAGQTVQVAFDFISGGTCCGTGPGWYVDDISLVASPVLTVPPTQTIYAGQTPDFTLSATLFPTNDTPIFGLVSATNVVLNTNTGVLTWTNTAPSVPSTNIITVKVTDTNVQLSTTASFIVQVLQPLVLTVPPTQTNYVGQELDVTISATNYADPDDYFTFATNSPTPANVSIDPYTGELTWKPTTAQVGPNTITITVTNNIEPFFRVTTNFVVMVSNPPPPTLIVPPTQKIYAGQTLTVTNIATSVFPNSTFTFALLSGPAGVTLTANGVLTWATTIKQPAGSTNVFITVTDSVSGLSATNHFAVVVSTNPPPPTLIVPPTQTNYAGQTLTVTNYAYYTNSVFPSSAFTFTTNPPTPPGVILVTTNGVGVLTWAIPIAQPAGTYTNAIQVTDSLSGDYATSNFLVQVLPAQPPTLIVPPMQLLYAGQMMDVTISATNSAYPGDTFTFVAFGPTNLNVSNLPKNGVLKWTPLTAQAPSANTIYVTATDTNSLSSTSNFLVLVFTTPPPGLTVPPTQTLPIKGFQFTLNTMPDTTWQIDASTNLLNWQSVGNYTANSSGTLQFTDLLATNYLCRFYRAVLP